MRLRERSVQFSRSDPDLFYEEKLIMLNRALNFKEEEEHILKALPALLKKDIWFRREVSVILSETLSTKDEIGKILEEMRISREETKQQFEATNRRFEDMDRKFYESIQELHKIFEPQEQKIKDVDTKVGAQGQAITELNTKVDKLDTKVDAHGQAIKDLAVAVNKVDIKIDTVGARWGIFAESTIRNTLRELLTKHLDVEEVVEWKVYDKDGVVFGYPQDIQIDFLIKNGEEFLGEIKSSAGSADVSVLSRKAKFYTQITGKNPKVLLVAVSINEECRKSCEKLNIQIITHEEIVS